MLVWLQNKFISFTVYFFDLYVNIFIWIRNNDYYNTIFMSKPKCIEPTESTWVSVCSLYFNNKYDICTTIRYDFKSVEEEYTSFYKNINNIEFHKKEHLFIGKTPDFYFSRTFFPGYKPSLENIIKEKCKFEFTYMEYTHPKMMYVVELILPNGIWMVSNELFTPAFILRLLQHQSSYYYFDLDYKINIVDHNIHNTTLSSSSYILLDKDTYHIITI